MIPYSVLDLSPVVEGGDARQALRCSLDLERHAELWGYRRYWVAEHHGMPGIASAATAVVLGHLGAGTSRIRLGAGGIMLPNHAPLGGVAFAGWRQRTSEGQTRKNNEENRSGADGETQARQ